MERAGQAEAEGEAVGANVIGVGVDMVEIGRIGDMMKRHPGAFVSKLMDEDEAREFLETDGAAAASEAAARFAAKEAVAKALGTGFDSRVRWKDVRIRRGAAGQPQVDLSGGAAAVARELGVRKVLISLTHCESHAIAFAVAVGPGGGQREARDGSGDAGDRPEGD